MKKFFSIVLVLSFVIGLSACGGGGSDETTGTTQLIEVEDTYVEIENNGGMSINFDVDTVKGLLGNFTSEQLRISGDIYEYTLVLSAEEYNGISGCRAEAIPAGGKKAEQVYFIDGYNCYVYDNALSKYVSVVSSPSGGNAVEGETTDVSVNTPADSGVDFQYHEGNNTNLQAKFSAYDLTAVGLEKELSEYILVVTARTATVSDEKVSVIEVYEKDGTLTLYRLGVSASNYYYFDYSTDSYVLL